MIEVENLCFDYSGTRALEHVSFQIEPKTITALVGPNGAGKTTLLRCLAALETPLSGKIKIAGWETDRFPREIHAITSYLSDFFGLYDDLTVQQNLEFIALSRQCPSADLATLIEQTVKRLDISEYLKVPAGKLSRGLRQRLAIAQAIIAKPKVLLLDEPAAGLDPQARHHLSQLLLSLQQEGMTLIVSSHILSELEDYSTHMLVLNKGKVIKHCALNDYQQTQEKGILLTIELTQEAKPFEQTIQSLPNIHIKTIQGKIITLLFQGNAQDQHDLLKLFIEKQVPVCSIQEQKQRMQDVYLNITHDKTSEE